MKRRRIARSLSLAILSAFSTACSGIPVSVQTDCAWALPHCLDDESKAWLHERAPWPQGLTDFLNTNGDHNELHGRFCKPAGDRCPDGD